jgi:DNA-binding NarL/FixJ family response regulator
MATRISIYDDNARILEALEILLLTHPLFELVGAYNNTKELLNTIDQSRPNIILMDINIPPVDGIESTRLITKAFPEVKVVIQTIFDEDDKVFAALCAGASGYILKNTPSQKIIAAIEEILQGGAPMSPAIAHKVLRLFKVHINTGPSISEQYELSSREKEVLRGLVDGLSYKMIADKCGVSFETVKSHIKHIYQKLKVASMTEAVVKAIRERIV